MTSPPRIHHPGSPRYERLRRGSARGADWNVRSLDRHPAVIVEASTAAEVVEAVRMARRHGWAVKARSGGHSWTDSSVRDGALLIDLSAMTECELDLPAGTARLGPGIKGQDLDRVLDPHGWYFPTGGCLDVGLGGFLLQGGFGWNRQVVGPACASVLAVDVVTAAGELVHADATANPELFWAARGAGAGFFGVVTRFHVRLHRTPPARLATSLLFPLAAAGDVARWLMEQHDAGRFRRELMVGMTICPALADTVPGVPSAAVLLRGSAAGDTVEAVRALLAPVDEMPLRQHAVHAATHTPVLISERRGLAQQLYPDGGLYVADNMWTDATAGELAGELTACVADLPSRRSHLSLEAYHPHALPDMAFSLEGRYYVSVYGVRGPAEGSIGPAEPELVAWTTRHMRRLEPLARGIQFADENLIGRPAAGLSPEHTRRLERLRDRHDPDRLFAGYLCRPDAPDGTAGAVPSGRQR